MNLCEFSSTSIFHQNHVCIDKLTSSVTTERVLLRCKNKVLTKVCYECILIIEGLMLL